MPKYVKDKKTGKWKGSIGDHKENVPSSGATTPKPMPTPEVTETTPDIQGVYKVFRRTHEQVYVQDTISRVAAELKVTPESLTRVYQAWRESEPDAFEDIPSPEAEYRYDLHKNAPQDPSSQRALRKLGYERYLATPYPVFVYGTLRSGQSNSTLMSGAVHDIQPAHVKGIGIYGSSYGFPYAAEHPDGTAVTKGEIVWLTDNENGETARSMLDHLEGFNSNHPSTSHYERVSMPITHLDHETGNPTQTTAWIYLARGSAKTQLRESDRILNGDWVENRSRFKLPDKYPRFNRF